MGKQSFESVKANAKSVRETLDTVKYEIDVFQREYRWEMEQIRDLIGDLEIKFLNEYDEKDERDEVQHYEKYYLGSIIISMKDNKRSIIDGQQRLTSLTLLLIYLNNLQKLRDVEPVPIEDLIFSTKYNKKSYNLNIEGRISCIEALFNNEEPDYSTENESVKNIIQRYGDIGELFSPELKDNALPYFIDWLIDNVILVHIETSSDDDAYEIFETMNDRGLNLTSTEMLKGYLLSKMDSDEKKIELNELWKRRISELGEISKKADLEFSIAWLRAKYAQSIRPGKKGSVNEDFEKITSRFHSWVRDHKDLIGLTDKTSYYNFVKINFDFYSKLYLRIYDAAHNFKPGFENLYYVENRKFPESYYYPLIMAPIEIDDSDDEVQKKIVLVSKFLEMYIVIRSVNRKTLASSSIRYTMFNLIKEIRNKSVHELSELFKKKIREFEVNMDGFSEFILHQQNKKFVHFLLARITNYIEKQSGLETSFENYSSREISKPFEIEHIWSNKFEEHKDEFDQNKEFDDWRNSLGALILLPSGFNQSFNDDKYETKLPHYNSQNLLARTLNPQCYEKNPVFLKFKKESKLPFKSHSKFKKQDILERQTLYQKICEKIWNLEEFDKIVNS